jgi:uncharacterized membrane protein YphA (DoxX/SURF4 family)
VDDLRRRFERIDVRLTNWMARRGVVLLRLSLGAVFLWFGALKFFPGLSPAQDLAGKTIASLSFGLVPPSVSLPGLAAWECLIGIGLLGNRCMRTTLALLALQMVGAVTPLFLFPEETFTRIPFAPTLEGQYIIKNVVLVSAALVVGATARGGDLVADPGVVPVARRHEEEARREADARVP